MKAATFQLTISSVDEIRFRGDARSVTAPGSEGELTVLANHEPLATELAPGVISVRTSDGETQTFSVERGVLEVSGNAVSVLL